MSALEYPEDRPVDRVIRTAELVECIIDHLVGGEASDGEDGSIGLCLSVMTVNRQILEAIKSRVWKEPSIPIVEALGRITDASRRQLYADHVQSAIVRESSQRHMGLLDGLEWPRLRRLWVDIQSRFDTEITHEIMKESEPGLFQYMHLSASRDEPIDPVIKLLVDARMQTSIKVLSLRTTQTVAMDSIHQLIIETPRKNTLENIILSTDANDISRFVESVSQCHKLSTLKITNLGLHRVPDMFVYTGRPFPKLSRLETKSKAVPAAMLLMANGFAPSLEDVLLTILACQETGTPLVNSLSSFTGFKRLKKLEVRFQWAQSTQAVTLSTSEFLSLGQSCPLLESLLIHPICDWDGLPRYEGDQMDAIANLVDGSAIDDMVLEQFAYQLPKLTCLDLGFNRELTGFTSRVLCIFARHCKLLQTLRLRGDIAMYEACMNLKISNLSLPDITDLCIGRIVVRDDLKQADLTNFRYELKQQFPRLSSIETYDEDWFPLHYPRHTQGYRDAWMLLVVTAMLAGRDWKDRRNNSPDPDTVLTAEDWDALPNFPERDDNQYMKLERGI